MLQSLDTSQQYTPVVPCGTVKVLPLSTSLGDHVILEIRDLLGFVK